MSPINTTSIDGNQLQIFGFKIDSSSLKNINNIIKSNPNIDTIVGNYITDIQYKFSELSNQASKQIKVAKFPQLTKISEGAFENTNIEEVHLASLQQLPNNAFAGCSQLKIVDIPKVDEIGDRAFYNCTSLEYFDAPSVNTIHENVFDNSGIKTLKMKALTFMDSKFGSCNNLTEVVLNSLSEIPSFAFQKCQSLRNIRIPKVSIIHKYAFHSCSQLETVHCNNVQFIEISAFEDSGLKGIHMNSATLIGDRAFLNCKRLTQLGWLNQIVSANSVPTQPIAKPNQVQIGSDAFLGLDPKLITNIVNLIGDNSLYYPQISNIFKAQLNKYAFKEPQNQELIKSFSENYRHKKYMYRNMKYGLDLDGPTRNCIKFLTDNISHCTNAKRLVLYRGIKGLNSLSLMANMKLTNSLKDFVDPLLEKVIFDRSFISTTISEATARFYMNRTTENDPGVIINIEVPNDIKIPLMPIANVNHEVVLNRYQKFIVDDVSLDNARHIINVYCTAINDDENTQQIEQDIYSSEEFKQYQEKFELSLGQYAYRNPKCYNVVHRAIEKIKANYQIDDSGDNIAQHSAYVQAFFSNPQSMGINIPGNTTDPNGVDLTAQQIKLMLKSEMPHEGPDSPGNLREKMAVLQSSTPTYTIEPLETKEPKIDSIPREEQFQEAFRRRANYQDEMGLPRSEREIQYQNKYARADSMSPIISNETRLTPIASHENQLYPIMGFAGKRLIAGTSETVKQLLTHFKSLGFTQQQDLLDFRLALMGYILPEHNGSLYEILQASHEVGVIGTENVSTAENMDKTVDPLTEKELREQVCQDKMFPYEICLKKYREDKDKKK